MYRIMPIVLITLSSVAAAAEPVDVRGTIEKGLAFLADEAVDWMPARKCASCHQVPMGIWGLNEAKKRGYAVDEKALADLTAWVLDPADPGKVFPVQGAQEKIVVNQAPLMLSLGMAAGDLKDDAAREGYRKMLKAVLEKQRPDGSWALFYIWEPSGPAPDVITSWVVLSLSAPEALELVPEAKEAREKALAWLAAEEAGPELQGTAMKLLLALRLGRAESDWKPLVEQIIGKQNADGGWSQVDGLASDAYATGVVLYVLGETKLLAGDVSTTKAPITKAQAYLAKTQHTEGDWEMASRDGGPKNKSASNTSPISYAATAWAVMGLARTTPAVGASGEK